MPAARNPYCQAFDLNTGQIIELRVDEGGLVYLMTCENLSKYCAGRDDYLAEGSMPFADPIELVTREAGRWFIVCEHQLQGTFWLRGGFDVKSGPLQMHRVKATGS